MNKNISPCSELSSKSTEPEASAPEEVVRAPAISLPLNTGEEYPVYDSDIAKWAELYPAVDIRQQLRNMRGWLDANLQRRKTKQGIKRFINLWLSREQNRGKAEENTFMSSPDKNRSSNKFKNFEERSYKDGELDALAMEFLQKGGI